ncbi:S-crystallin SL11-like [Ruditapes philippinarum]|uniref:S-crystallin SL11-like n=1 Tax=Ruditapes philippinarum TaxID=129788 RepID=UPI00295B83EB|nr:S-crystallin SL11-like [Ruditapes philippinarum]
MPTKYKLTYFNGRGRAELSRMIFNAAGVKFEDDRVEFSQWPQLKAGTPQGSLPVLEIDGKKRICQSFAVARYLGREFKLYGKGNSEMVMVDQILDTLLDMFTPYVTIAFGKDSEEEKKKKFEEFDTNTLPTVLGNIEKLVAETGKKGFAVGDSLTVADLALYVYLENCNALTKVPKDKYPGIASSLETTAKQPKVAAYLKTRQQTPF